MKIQPDKIKHFIAGLIIASVCLILGLSTMWTLVVVTALGALKEIRDLCGFRTPEVLDLIWTIAGAVPAVLSSLLF